MDWPIEREPNGEYEPTLALAKIILDAHPWGLRDVLVFGERGIGKSVYALKVMEQVFRAFGYSEEEAWQLALDSLIFKLDDFLDLARRIRREECIYPIITVDDAGSGFGAKKYFTNRHAVDDLKGVLDTARTWVTGLIFTTPSSGGLLKDVRDLHCFEVEIKKGSGGSKSQGYENYPRRAKALNKRPGYGGKTWYSKRKGYIDEFSCYLPNAKYKEYWKKRCKFSDQALEKAGDADA